MAHTRSALFSIFLMCFASLCLSQSRPAPAAPPAPDRIEPKIERITHEDAGSRIDELRVGGDTKSITVSPKGGMPPYELSSGSANRQPVANEREAGSGKSGWKILGF